MDINDIKVGDTIVWSSCEEARLDSGAGRVQLVYPNGDTRFNDDEYWGGLAHVVTDNWSVPLTAITHINGKPVAEVGLATDFDVAKKIVDYDLAKGDAWSLAASGSLAIVANNAGRGAVEFVEYREVRRWTEFNPG